MILFRPGDRRGLIADTPNLLNVAQRPQFLLPITIDRNRRPPASCTTLRHERPPLLLTSTGLGEQRLAALRPGILAHSCEIVSLTRILLEVVELEAGPGGNTDVIDDVLA